MKTKHLLLIAAFAGTMVSCNSGVENDHDGDSITVDSVVTADSVIVDTTANSGTQTDTL